MLHRTKSAFWRKDRDLLSKRPGLERVDSFGDMLSDSSAHAFFAREIPDLVYVFDKAAIIINTLYNMYTDA